MASEAKVVVGYEHDDDGLKSMDEASYLVFLQEGIDDLDHGRWVDNSVITADIAAMRAEIEANRTTTHPATPRG